MVPGLGVEPRRARGPRDFKATGKRQRIKDLANSLPFPVSEESEECRRVRGLWTPRRTPVPPRLFTNLSRASEAFSRRSPATRSASARVTGAKRALGATTDPQDDGGRGLGLRGLPGF